jgi:predicted Zn-dependent peptidase
MKDHAYLHGDLNSAMKYLVVQIQSGDKLSVQVRVNVGSRDETDDIRGISHLLEHMFFQGSKKYPTSKELQIEIYKCGGELNAYTDYHETVYHTEGSKKCIKTIVEIMSSSLYESLILAKNLENEKKVVINEINDGLSDPESFVLHNLMSTVYQGTRLEQDIVGTGSSVKNITIQKLKNFLNTYYSQNMIVTLCSSDPPKKGVELLKRYFSEIPQYKVKPMKPITSDKKRHLYPNHPFQQTKGKIKFTKDSSEQSFISLSFPSYRYSEHQKGYAMILVSEILTGYMNSRLYTVLRQEKGLIYHMNSGSEFNEDMGIFIVNCTVKNQKKTVTQCVKLLLQNILDLSDTLTEADLDSSKAHLVESIRLGKDEPHYIAAEYAQDLYHLDQVVTLADKIKTIQKLTLKDIREISKEVFQKQLCCISYSGSSNYLKFD